MSELPDFKINKGLIGLVAVVVIAATILFKSAITIGSGQAGVVERMSWLPKFP